MNGAILDRVSAVLAARAGMSVSGSMRNRMNRYLCRAAESAGVPGEEYALATLADPGRFQRLIEELTVQESSFFRDPGQFHALAEHILPRLSPPILIWSCGCAHGQEPYSLAMLLLEGGYPDASVIATDISSGALAGAQAGRYRSSGLRGLPAGRRAAWMVPDGDQWSVRDTVRRRVRFARHNIATDPPPFGPGECQIIFCRNVLIYFHQDALIEALKRMLAWLPEGGLLFLGYSESLWQVTDVFDLVQVGSAFVYRKPGAIVRHTAAAPPLVAAPPTAAAPPPAIAAEPGALSQLTVLMREGGLAMAGGDPRAAAGAFRQAAYLDSAHPVAHFQLGLALEAQGEAAPAARAYRAARTALRRVDPASPPPELLGYRVEVLIRLIEARLEHALAGEAT